MSLIFTTVPGVTATASGMLSLPAGAVAQAGLSATRQAEPKHAAAAATATATAAVFVLLTSCTTFFTIFAQSYHPKKVLVTQWD